MRFWTLDAFKCMRFHMKTHYCGYFKCISAISSPSSVVIDALVFYVISLVPLASVVSTVARRILYEFPFICIEIILVLKNLVCFGSVPSLYS